jgi:hypothetical protein
LPSPSPETGAYNPQVLPPRPEMGPSQTVEASPERPAPQEVQPAGQVQGISALPIPTVPDPPAAGAVPVLNPVPAHNDNPASASDDDVIEKEWVDKAKKIVTQTKDDPYKQEQEVSKLQADYLKKRYGKEVKLASD